MMPVRIVTVLVGCGAACVIAITVASSRWDGPIGPLPGGPFRSGELFSETANDWAFLTDVAEVELQLLTPPHSRTTHVVVLESQAYVPCGIVRIGPFVLVGQAFWKRWPAEVQKDPRVILRSNGRLYPARAVRVTDPELHRKLIDAVSAKYHLGLEGPPDLRRAWFFHLEPRAEQAGYGPTSRRSDDGPDHPTDLW